jgi:hypothetical protein
MRKIDDIVPDIRFLPALVLTTIFGITLQLAGDWKLMLIAGALGALFIRKLRIAFLLGFLGVGLAWSILFVYLAITAQAMAVANMFIGLLGLEGFGIIVIVISVLIGALLGGFGGLLGRAIYEMINEILPSETSDAMPTESAPSSND